MIFQLNERVKFTSTEHDTADCWYCEVWTARGWRMLGYNERDARGMFGRATLPEAMVALGPQLRAEGYIE